MLSLVSAFGSGLYLYSVKHRTGVIDRQIVQAIQATQAAQQQTGLLRAEWTSLNDPERLQNLATRYLALQPAAPGQFAQIATLPDRIRQAAATPRPAPPTVSPAATPPSPDAAGPALAAAAPEPVAVDATAPHPAPRAAPRRPAAPVTKRPYTEHTTVLTVAASQKIQPPGRRIAAARAEPPLAAASPYHHIGQARSDPPHDLALPQGNPLPLAAPTAPADPGPAYRNAMARPAPPPHPFAPVIAARPSYPQYYPPAWPPYGTPYAAVPSPRPSLPPPVPLEPEYQ